MSGCQLAVVMPAYNEHDGIVAFIREIGEQLARDSADVRFVVVDDASPTPLATVLQDLSPHLLESLTILVNETNLGHGPSVLRGYRHALAQNPDAIIHVDGDGQFHGVDFPRLLAGLEHAEAVHGVRRNRLDPWYRKAITHSLQRVVPGAAQQGLDVNTPFRAYRPTTLELLLEKVPGQSIVPHIHLTILEKSLGIKTAHVSVEHRARRGPTVTGTTWRGWAARAHLPSIRLARFCGRAAWEIALWQLCRKRTILQVEAPAMVPHALEAAAEA